MRVLVVLIYIIASAYDAFVSASESSLDDVLINTAGIIGEEGIDERFDRERAAKRQDVDEASESALSFTSATPVCSCSPREFTIKLQPTQRCDVNDLQDKSGIGDSLCTTNTFDTETKVSTRSDSSLSNHQLHKMTIVNIQFVEFGSDDELIVINQDDTYSNVSLHNGAEVSFTSISNMLGSNAPMSDQVGIYPGGVQIAIRGVIHNGQNEEQIVSQHVTWSYTCDDLPIEAGDNIGWVHFQSITPPLKEYCPHVIPLTQYTTNPSVASVTSSTSTPTPKSTKATPIMSYSTSMSIDNSSTKSDKEQTGKAKKAGKYDLQTTGKTSKQEKKKQSSTKVLSIDHLSMPQSTTKAKSSKEASGGGTHTMPDIIDAKAEKVSTDNMYQSKQSKKSKQGKAQQTPSSTTYLANFGKYGTVILVLKDEKYDMNIDLKNIGNDMFPDGTLKIWGLTVHLHSGRVGEAVGAIGSYADGNSDICDSAFTSGHYDPYAACGGASTAQSEGRCDPDSGDKYPDPDYEIGDISGSQGKVPVHDDTAIKSIANGPCPECNTQYLDPKEEDPTGTSSTWYSVVFHASDGARVLCANLLKED